ncbi:hypothetical protein [Streptomyces sp. DW26H14]|uniref:hypothetical protein n=1 Tax=Streptomyces sp. DW26H14 TaxID=3435395 RepID=UPI00403D5E3D
MTASDKDVTRWQQRSHKAIGEFLAHAAKAGLPPLTWIIASGTGAITGEASILLSTPAKQRADVEVWAKYLGVKVHERTGRDGVTHLWAQFVWHKDRFVGGAIRADIHPPFNEDGAR